MRRKPVGRNSFWGDVLNMLLLRRVNRATPQE